MRTGGRNGRASVGFCLDLRRGRLGILGRDWDRSGGSFGLGSGDRMRDGFLRDAFKNIRDLVGGIVSDRLPDGVPFPGDFMMRDGGVSEGIEMNRTGSSSEQRVSGEEHTRLQRFQFKTLRLSLLVVQAKTSPLLVQTDEKITSVVSS